MESLDLVQETIDVDGLRLSIVRPRQSDALLDEEAFEHEEFLPYWAEVWPSGLALARVVRRREVSGLRVVELGCGLAVPSIVAALGGALVLATDWSPEALAVATENAARNGAEVETELRAWADPEPFVRRAPWDLVLAADVLYEQRNVDQLLELLPKLVEAEGEILVAEPGRPPAERFFETAAQTFRIEPLGDRVHRLVKG